ncbi:MAG: hypothetical protein U1E33_08085 [Rhodospirillales bacterium]
MRVSKPRAETRSARAASSALRAGSSSSRATTWPVRTVSLTLTDREIIRPPVRNDRFTSSSA